MMKNNPEIDNDINEGIEENKIFEMESYAGHKFPDAYREFLFLGGENNNVTQFMDASSYSIYQNLRKSVERVLMEDNFKIDKDFWVIAALDGGEQFHFFFFDEGENPPVYYYCSYMGEFEDSISDDRPGIIKIRDNFTTYVEKMINANKS